MDFESLRDSVIATCGTLDPTIGGRSVDLVSDPTVTRRTVYAWINRPLQPLLSTFDVPDNSVTASDRHESTSPGQALFLMNGGFVDHHATRLLQLDEFRRLTAVDARIVWIFERLLQREPTVEEQGRVGKYLSRGDDSRTWLNVVQSLLLSNEFTHAL